MPNVYTKLLPNASLLKTMTWAERAKTIEAHFRDAHDEHQGWLSGYIFASDGKRRQRLANWRRRLKRVNALALELSVNLVGAA